MSLQDALDILEHFIHYETIDWSGGDSVKNAWALIRSKIEPMVDSTPEAGNAPNSGSQQPDNT